jgi:hypothetical protein
MSLDVKSKNWTGAWRLEAKLKRGERDDFDEEAVDIGGL